MTHFPNLDAQYEPSDHSAGQTEDPSTRGSPSPPKSAPASPAQVIKAHAILGKALAKAMARDTRESQSRSVTPEVTQDHQRLKSTSRESLSEATPEVSQEVPPPVATPEPSEEEEVIANGERRVSTMRPISNARSSF